MSNRMEFNAIENINNVISAENFIKLQQKEKKCKRKMIKVRNFENSNQFYIYF